MSYRIYQIWCWFAAVAFSFQKFSLLVSVSGCIYVACIHIVLKLAWENADKMEPRERFPFFFSWIHFFLETQTITGSIITKEHAQNSHIALFLSPPIPESIYWTVYWTCHLSKSTHSQYTAFVGTASSVAFPQGLKVSQVSLWFLCSGLNNRTILYQLF